MDESESALIVPSTRFTFRRGGPSWYPEPAECIPFSISPHSDAAFTLSPDEARRLSKGTCGSRIGGEVGLSAGIASCCDSGGLLVCDEMFFGVLDLGV